MEGACGTLNQMCSPFEALCFPCVKMMDAERCGMTLRMRVMVMGALMGLYQCADTAYDASQPLAGDHLVRRIPRAHDPVPAAWGVLQDDRERLWQWRDPPFAHRRPPHA